MLEAQINWIFKMEKESTISQFLLFAATSLSIYGAKDAQILCATKGQDANL